MESNKIVEKVILFEDDERSLNYKFEPFAQKLKSTKILSLEYDKDEFLKFTVIGASPEIGSVYYKHPFKSDTYVNSNLAEFYFMNEKLELIGEIVKFLGAKSFVASVHIEAIEKIEITLEGQIKFKVIEANTNYEIQEISKLNSSLKLKREFEEDVTFDKLINYDRALKYLQHYNLSAESSIIGLINSRDPSVGNKSKGQKLTTELTSEYNSTLEFAAGLKVMGDVFSTSLGYNKQFESIKKIRLEMEVLF